MDHPVQRFASNGVFDRPSPAEPPEPRAEVLARLVNPRGLTVAPARLVAVIDAAVQEALEESPVILWEAEEVVRFELPDARILLVLSEGDTPGQAGLTLGVVFEGENCHEIARCLSRLIARTLCLRYPHLECLDEAGAFAHDAEIDADVAALIAQPLELAQPGLPPVETLVDQVWRKASARAPLPRHLPSPAFPGFWQRLRQALTPPVIAPMRQSVRALALMLLAMGLLQGPLQQQAQAETRQSQP